MITDSEGKILFINSRIKELTGYTSGELVGHFSYKTLLPTDSWNLILNKNELAAGSVEDNYAVEIYRKDYSKF